MRNSTKRSRSCVMRFLLTKESQRWDNSILAFPLFGKDRPKIGKGRFEPSRTPQCVRLFSRYHGGHSERRALRIASLASSRKETTLSDQKRLL